MAPMLAERLGEPVDVATRAIWPTSRLPSLVQEWMTEEAPDLAMFSVQSYWFLYESMPARFRRFGAAGRLLSAFALRAAATPWLAHNAIFRWGRRTLQRIVHGRPHFEPAEVIAVATRSIGAMLQHEGAYVVVVGPSGGNDWAADNAARVRMERRRKVVDDAMSEFCRARHIEYWAPSMFANNAAQPRSLQGDGIHLDREGHRQMASRYLDLVGGLCERARAHHATTGARSEAAGVSG
jgi:hypothetical protein